jgi:hypothetical protein
MFFFYEPPPHFANISTCDIIFVSKKNCCIKSKLSKSGKAYSDVLFVILHTSLLLMLVCCRFISKYCSLNVVTTFHSLQEHYVRHCQLSGLYLI